MPNVSLPGCSSYPTDPTAAMLMAATIVKTGAVFSQRAEFSYCVWNIIGYAQAQILSDANPSQPVVQYAVPAPLTDNDGIALLEAIANKVAAHNAHLALSDKLSLGLNPNIVLNNIPWLAIANWLIQLWLKSQGQ